MTSIYAVSLKLQALIKNTMCSFSWTVQKSY